MIYVDYEYYHIYFGGLKFTETDNESFYYYSRLASKKLDNLTANRIKEATEDVKDCVCAIMDYLLTQSQSDDGIASESLADRSISYRGKGTSEKRSDILDIARTYLGNSWLLYGGFNES